MLDPWEPYLEFTERIIMEQVLPEHGNGPKRPELVDQNSTKTQMNNPGWASLKVILGCI